MYGAKEDCVRFKAVENRSYPVVTHRVFALAICSRRAGCLDRSNRARCNRCIHQIERQRRSSERKGEENMMNRRSFQQGYVSKPIKTKQGQAFKIRWRIRDADGKWRQ